MTTLEKLSCAIAEFIQNQGEPDNETDWQIRLKAAEVLNLVTARLLAGWNQRLSPEPAQQRVAAVDFSIDLDAFAIRPSAPVKEATRGLTFQGKPCLRGHSGLRYVRDHSCVQCSREFGKRRVQTGKMKVVAAKNRAKKAASKGKPTT